jgi:hypothetical protein
LFYTLVIAEIVKPSLKRHPKFGTLKGLVSMSPEEFRQATRPMTNEEAEAFSQGRY